MVPMLAVEAPLLPKVEQARYSRDKFTLIFLPNVDPSMKYLRIEYTSHTPNLESKCAVEVYQTPTEPDSFLESYASSRRMSPNLINAKATL
jgi:hypothetical protein